VKDWTITLKEAEDLARVAGNARRNGAIPHEDVVRKMLKDMERELRRMVSEYDGSPEQSRELLQALVVSEEEGVPPAACAEIRHELAVRIRELRAA
jgi:hypothetical protein